MRIAKTKMKNFTFNKENHYYELDGKRLYGVTTILGVIAKPALIPWAVKMTVDTFKNLLDKDDRVEKPIDSRSGVMTRFYKVAESILDDLLKEAKSAHRKKKEEAGAKGTDAHARIEELITNAIKTHNGSLDIPLGKESEQVSNFVDWAVKNEVKFLASEKQLYSESAWVAGTTDMVFEMKGKKYVGDVKTSSAIYPEHFYQMAAYRMMLEEMGETGFDGSVVVRIGKDGKFNEDKDVQYRYDYQTDLSAFLGALAIFKAGETHASNHK